MANYFIVDNDTIVNIIVADTADIAERVTGLTAIDSEDPTVKWANIGDTWDAETGIYGVEPIPVDPEAPAV